MKKSKIIRFARLLGFILFALAYPAPGQAADRIPVNIVSENNYLYEAALLERDEGSLSPLHRDFNPLLNPQRLSAVFAGYHEKAIWLQFRLRNESTSTQKSIIHPAGFFPSVASMVVFSKSGKRLSQSEGGLNSRFNQREGSSHQAYFQIELAPSEEKIVLVRVQQEALLSPKIILSDAVSWTRSDRDRAMFLGLAIGACITLLIYSLFIYWRLRDSVLISYLMLVVSTLLSVCYWSGLHANWGEAYSPWQLSLFPSLPRLTGLSLLLLGIFLVRLPERKPFLNSFLFGLMGMSIVTILLQGFYPQVMSRLGDLCHVLMLTMAVGLFWERGAETFDRYVLLMGGGAALCLLGSGSMVVKIYAQAELIELPFLSVAYILGTLLISVGLILRMQAMRRMLHIGLRRELMLHEETNLEQQILLGEFERERDNLRLRASLAEKRLADQSQESLDGMRLRAIGETAAQLAAEAQLSLQEITHVADSISREVRTGRMSTKNLKSGSGRIFRMATRLQHIMRNMQRAASASDEPKIFLANDFVKDCLDLCQDRLVRQGVEIEVEVSGENLWIEGCFGRLSEAFLALIQNASDAVHGSDIKRITWQIRRVDDSEGAWLHLQLSDSGPGVPTSVRNMIFTPAFSTKSESSGMGLIRAVAILQKHGGSVNLDPDAIATTFVVRLPLYGEAQRLAG